jgi:hypothetical protein
MTALITLAAVGVFAAAGFAGIIGVASVAIRREEKDLTLTREATGTVTRAGRALNGVCPRSAPDRWRGAGVDTCLARAARAWPGSSTVGKGVLRR